MNPNPHDQPELDAPWMQELARDAQAFKGDAQAFTGRVLSAWDGASRPHDGHATAPDDVARNVWPRSLDHVAPPRRRPVLWAAAAALAACLTLAFVMRWRVDSPPVPPAQASLPTDIAGGADRAMVNVEPDPVSLLIREANHRLATQPGQISRSIQQTVAQVNLDAVMQLLHVDIPPEIDPARFVTPDEAPPPTREQTRRPLLPQNLLSKGQA